MKQRAFSLIELLVVISIIAILASMIMVTVNLVRSQAQGSVCANQERQLAMAIISYATDFEGILPSGIPFNDVGGPTPNQQYADSYWAHVIGDQLDQPWTYMDPFNQARIFRCPGQQRFSYPGFKTSYVMSWYTSHPDFSHPPLGYTWISLSRYVPSRNALFGEVLSDECEGSVNAWGLWAVKRIDFPDLSDNDGWPVAFKRHRGSFNAAYADGHVQRISKSDYYGQFMVMNP